MKQCSKCGGPGPFGKHHGTKDGLQYWCKTCQKILSAARYKANPTEYAHKHQQYRTTFRERHPERLLWTFARRRAKALAYPFNIEPEDIIIPETCPLLGIPLIRSNGYATDNTPSLDRKNAQLGYIKGNVWVISYRANRLKSDATLEELELLVRNLRASMG